MLEPWRAAGSVPGVSDDPVSLERLLETSADALLVAEADGRVVGTIIAGCDGWRANFYRLAVLPSARRAASPSSWSTRPNAASPSRAPAASARS